MNDDVREAIRLQKGDGNMKIEPLKVEDYVSGTERNYKAGIVCIVYKINEIILAIDALNGEDKPGLCKVCGSVLQKEGCIVCRGLSPTFCIHQRRQDECPHCAGIGAAKPLCPDTSDDCPVCGKNRKPSPDELVEVLKKHTRYDYAETASAVRKWMKKRLVHVYAWGIDLDYVRMSEVKTALGLDRE